jgi:mono/diheme cytochrome c family protein
LAGTRNGVPTLEDLEKVLARGMPGSSMPKFDTLPQTDRVQLAEEVLRLRREGIREAAAKAALEEGEELDEAEVRRAIEVCTTPAEAVRVPQDWPDPEQAAARGRESYAALGCVKCHGEDGTGAADEWLFDDQGEPSRPRDLVHEPFKGGREAESIYLRIAVGMPGTAHPAAGNVPEEELTDLVQYLRQLAREPQTTLTNFERRDVADVREYLARLNGFLGHDKGAGKPSHAAFAP